MTAIVVSTGERECLNKTLARIFDCDPRPAEVLLHLDVASEEISLLLSVRFPHLAIFRSLVKLGPGGARGKLIKLATHDLISSFDDDSFPETIDYFRRAWEVAMYFPDAAIISAASSGAEREAPGFMNIGVYSGCGCVFRRWWLIRVPGFVPLTVAYGMEETDVSLQLYAIGGLIIHDPKLLVKHEHPEGECRNLTLWNASVLANTILLPFLRYPWWLLVSVGMVQVFSRIFWVLKNHCSLGVFIRCFHVFAGYLVRYIGYRHILAHDKIIEWLVLKRNPLLISGNR